MRIFRSALSIIFLMGMGLTLGGCPATTGTRDKLLDSDQSQLALRSIQSRSFETTDREKTLRTIIATLQDLGFVVEKADRTLGTVTGTKLSGYQLRMTVSIRPRGEAQTIVRANAQYNLEAVTEPLPYQQFFASLEKGMFLAAQEVD